MNTYKLALKNEIKNLVAKQVWLKNQRKTVNLSGTREIEPYQAAYSHDLNRRVLRNMYMAYGLLRGKTADQIEVNPKTPINMDSVNKIMRQYDGSKAVRISA